MRTFIYLFLLLSVACSRDASHSYETHDPKRRTKLHKEDRKKEKQLAKVSGEKKKIDEYQEKKRKESVSGVEVKTPTKKKEVKVTEIVDGKKVTRYVYTEEPVKKKTSFGKLLLYFGLGLLGVLVISLAVFALILSFALSLIFVIPIALAIAGVVVLAIAFVFRSLFELIRNSSRRKKPTTTHSNPGGPEKENKKSK